VPGKWEKADAELRGPKTRQDGNFTLTNLTTTRMMERENWRDDDDGDDQDVNP
jgi:hypothetical protein